MDWLRTNFYKYRSIFWIVKWHVSREARIQFCFLCNFSIFLLDRNVSRFSDFFHICIRDVSIFWVTNFSRLFILSGVK